MNRQIELCDWRQTDWANVPIDTEVLISPDGENWEPRYYAGLVAGKPTVWAGYGNTSKSPIHVHSRWEFMKLA